ncbi:MAG: toll/interleukin-1 receptor domain-containing protein [Bacteroidales bacterium]|nr:toll/interleukin-1 receptor domain-containing protein [Bacteroidales bacterium]
MNHDVFISYSRKDEYVVNEICEFFTKNEITYWIDKRKIYAGSEFMGDIVNAIRQSKVTLFISSLNSNKSIYTAKEIAIAFNERKYIIPYKIDNSSFNDKLEFLLCDINWVEAIPFDTNKVQVLVQEIKSLLSANKEKEIYSIPKREFVDISDWDEPQSSLLKFLKKIFSDH